MELGSFLDLLKAAAPVVGLGLVEKHLVKWIPNNSIPYVNAGLGTIVGTLTTGDLGQGMQFGAAVSTSATGLHQILKVGLRWATKGRIQSF
jgi:hypothetical protein